MGLMNSRVKEKPAAAPSPVFPLRNQKAARTRRAVIAAAVYMIFEIVSLVEDRRNGVSVWSILFEVLFNLAAVGACLYLFEVMLRIKGDVK